MGRFWARRLQVVTLLSGVPSRVVWQDLAVVAYRCGCHPLGGCCGGPVQPPSQVASTQAPPRRVRP